MKRARKWLALLLAMVILLALTACGGNQPNNNFGKNNVDGDQQNESQQETFDEQKVLSQLEVNEYRTYAGPQDVAIILDGERQLVYHVKNNSNFHVKLTFKITTYNADNEVVQILHEEIEALEKGAEAVLKCTRIEEYQFCEYEIKAEEVAIKESVTDKISSDMIKTKEKMLVTVTNNSEHYINVEKYLLCFENGRMVYCHEFIASRMLGKGKSETSEWTTGFDDQYDDYKLVLQSWWLY